MSYCSTTYGKCEVLHLLCGERHGCGCLRVGCLAGRCWCVARMLLCRSKTFIQWELEKFGEGTR